MFVCVCLSHCMQCPSHPIVSTPSEARGCSTKTVVIRGLTEKIPNWRNLIKLGIVDLFSDSALPESEVTYPQLGILSPTGDLKLPIGDSMPKWGYFLLVV